MCQLSSQECAWEAKWYLNLLNSIHILWFQKWIFDTNMYNVKQIHHILSVLCWKMQTLCDGDRTIINHKSTWYCDIIVYRIILMAFRIVLTKKLNIRNSEIQQSLIYNFYCVLAKPHNIVVFFFFFFGGAVFSKTK